MEVVIYLFRCFFTDTADFLQVFDSRLRDFLNRTEVIEQIAFSRSADSLNLIQTRFINRFGAPFTMRPYCKAMRFIAQILQIKSYRRLKRKSKTFSSQHMIIPYRHSDPAPWK